MKWVMAVDNSDPCPALCTPSECRRNITHPSPNVSCSIGVMHKRRPVVGVISQPFLNRIVSYAAPSIANGQFSARDGGGAFMNRTTPLPLTGGIPQPLSSLSHAMIAAECKQNYTSLLITTGGSDRREVTITTKLNGFRRLNGDPAKGIEGGVMVHALRSESAERKLTSATGATTVNLVHVAAGELDISWYVTR